MLAPCYVEAVRGRWDGKRVVDVSEGARRDGLCQGSHVFCLRRIARRKGGRSREKREELGREGVLRD